MKLKFLLILIVLLMVSACTESINLPADRTTPTVIESLAQPSNVVGQHSLRTSTPFNTQVSTITSTPTFTPEPPTATPTPGNLETFSYNGLYPGILPVQYIEDPCIYLENRWGEGKSAPGTIVVPIMFHSVAKPGRDITDSTTISMAYFEYFMNFAEEMGFSTITVNELIGFLKNNEEIPEHSMLLILDDRRPGVTELFIPYLEANDWTLTLGWPTTDGTDDSLWARMEGLADSGRLDVQSHGHNHIYIQGYTPLEAIEEEIYQPIEVIKEHFGTLPEAIIWPGGNFTQQAVEIAREAGFEVGFTVYSRGPLLFNWIPLGEQETAVGDPLMVLPRFWSTAADNALRDALEISEAAREAALAVRSDELAYYETYCQPVGND
jgi:peptidoglycan/xylan/chitin deacetylase (PgdA/CDA1 family)